MPKNLDECVRKVMAKGKDEKTAWAICKTSLDMTKNKEDMDEVIRNAESMCNDEKMALQKNTEIFSANIELKSIQGVDIFAAGDWNGDDYTVDDLDKLALAFNETKDKLKPYLKLGHGDEQNLLRADELPAAGYISRVYREGRKLFADFVNIPSKIYELIKRGAYTKKSAEIYKDIKIDGKLFPWAIKAVALLGGETPAVHDLDEILALYGTKDKAIAFSSEAELRRYDFYADLLEKENCQEDKKTMELEELKKENDLLKSQIVALTDENKVLKEAQSKTDKELEESKAFSESLKVECEKLKSDKRHTEIDAKIDSFVQGKKISPAQAKEIKEYLYNSPSEIKFKVGEQEKTYQDLIYSLIEKGNFTELSDEEKSQAGKKQNLEDEVNSYMANNHVSYKEALEKIAIEKGLKSL